MSSPKITDDSEHRWHEHEQVHAMPEGPQKDLAMYMHQHCHFPDEPVFEHTHNDELVTLVYQAGGGFYQKDGKLTFFPMTEQELDNWWVEDKFKA
jgi:hypothetical protein